MPLHMQWHHVLHWQLCWALLWEDFGNTANAWEKQHTCNACNSNVIQNNDMWCHTGEAVDVCAAKVSDKDAVDPAMNNLRLLQQLPLGVFSTVKQHDGLLGSDSYAVWAPA